MTPKKPTTVWVTVGEGTMSQARDLNPLWQAVLCVLLAFLVMRCWSEEGESQPLDLFVVKRTATDRSTTSTPGPMRWEIARKR